MEIYLDLKTALITLAIGFGGFIAYTVVMAFLAMFNNYVAVVGG